MQHILFIVGSLRRESYNRQLAKQAEQLLQGKAEVSYLDFADLPFMNQDIEFPAPAAVQRVRDEAHRFGITHHRNLRSKAQTQSVLREIPGVGPKTEEKLLKQFKSYKRIKEASLEDLTAAVGPKLAALIHSTE